MATTTPNFGWPVPTSTDLVKDGAVAIESLGDAVDASLLDLKGGTTNQVLAKNSNTDMDFKWVSDATGMTNPMTTTGDTIYSSSGSTPARLGIGSSGQVLTVAAGVPSWATPATATSKVVQIVYASINTTVNSSTNSYVDTLLTATITPTSASNKVLVFVEQNGLYKDTTNVSGSLKIVRASTDILVFSTNYGYNGSSGAGSQQQIGGAGASYLDAPATTSATTYKTMFKANSASAYVGVQQDNEYSTITLMEVTP